MKSEAPIPNEIILASAGSGKTFQLTNRYIALMGADLLADRPVRPERIVAVTFTRKAAGEFFDSILTKLAKAADSQTEADKLIPPTSDPLYRVLSQLNQEHYRKLLRIFIDRMPRLFLNTLDAFFASILRTFPAEFGLAGDFEVLDDHLSEIAKQQVYLSVFKRQPYGTNDAQEEFLEAFRQATFGKEESKIRQVLDAFIDDQHEVFLNASSGEKWGTVGAIWPDGTDWFEKTETFETLFARLFELLEASDEDLSKQMIFWDEFRDEAPLHNPGTPMSTRVKFFVNGFLARWKDVERGDVELPINRNKQRLTGELCRTTKLIVKKLIAAELEVKLKRTHGMWEILSRYEAAYARLVRRRGKLTFQDMELILSGHEFGTDHPAPILTQIPGDETRMRIDYRLDAQYDHWLLDEFQDTNVMQWNVIANLVDEAVQDTTGERSLFQVGDVKQAIFAWRGGDTKLFQDIYQHYGGDAGGQLIKRDLNVSWRSGHDVIDTANLIFKKEAHFDLIDFPQSVIDRWDWGKHIVAPPNDDLAGYCGWINPLPQEGEKNTTQEDYFAVVVALLEEIQPIERGISCAILVQRNNVGHDMVDYIRAHTDVSVTSEAKIYVATDNPVTLALLSLLRFAAHPGDQFAWHHLAMTPFAAVFESEDLTRGSVASRVLESVFTSGFEETVRDWTIKLEQSGFELGRFSENRAESLALAARIFDQSGSRDIDEFISYAERFTIRESDSKGAVQVMTVHKAKGLTFDMVLLPDLGGNKLTEIRRNIGVKKDSGRKTEWVYDLPSSEISDADEVLADYREECQAEAAYENLCKYYVALTRARQANYLITAAPNPKSRSKNFIYFLDQCLSKADPVERQLHGGLDVEIRYESEGPTTNWNWYEDREKPTDSSDAADTRPLPAILLDHTTRLRPRRRTPSGSESHEISAAQLFGRSGRGARNYGTLVHALFEEIEWLDEISQEKLHERFNRVTASDPAQLRRAIAEVEACFDQVDVRNALSKPEEKATCWLERRFEILLNDEWLSGTFDRVVIESDKATILDFKTDEVSENFGVTIEEKVEIYRPQLETYREVLSKITGLPSEKIVTQLFFTKAKQVVTVE